MANETRDARERWRADRATGCAWRQDETTVTVKVAPPRSLALARAERWDARGTSARLALSAPPYSWRADLYDDVETRATTIERTAREVIFRCVKKVSKPWPRLTAVGAAEDVARRRADAERDAAADAERAEAERAMEKRRAARAFLEAQWAIDDRRAVAGARPPTPSVATEMRPARVARLPAFDAARLAKPPRARVEIDVVFTPSARLPARRAS